MKKLLQLLKRLFQWIFRIKQPIDNWRFEVVFQREELFNFLRWSSNPFSTAETPFSQLKYNARKFGAAINNAHEFLESNYFMCTGDGTLKKGKMVGLPINTVEIDLFEFGNYAGLCNLGLLEGYKKNGRGDSVFEFENFRIHGHLKDNPLEIFYLGFDHQGLFLWNRHRNPALDIEIKGLLKSFTQ